MLLFSLSILQGRLFEHRQGRLFESGCSERRAGSYKASAVERAPTDSFTLSHRPNGSLPRVS